MERISWEVICERAPDADAAEGRERRGSWKGKEERGDWKGDGDEGRRHETERVKTGRLVEGKKGGKREEKNKGKEGKWNGDVEEDRRINMGKKR